MDELVNKLNTIIKKEFREELMLNHIFDLNDKLWLISVRTKKEKDLMDPYYTATKSGLKIKGYVPFENLKEFNAALKRKVY